MTSLAWAFAGLTAVFALADWVAVATERPGWRPLTKPATLVALIGVAICITPVDSTIRTWMVIGLVLSLVGDVALLLPARWFVVGLAAFLGGHIAYVVALQMAPRSIGWTVAGLAVVTAAAALVGRAIVASVRSGPNPELTIPVIAYVAVISAMVVSAFGTTSSWAAAGALLFYASDAVLAWNRFVDPLRWGPLAVMVTYHLGQAGLVAWLIHG